MELFPPRPFLLAVCLPTGSRAWSSSLAVCEGFLAWPWLRAAKSSRRSLSLTFSPNRREMKLQQWFLAAVLQHTAAAHYIWQADL